MLHGPNPKTQNSSRNYDAQIGRWLQPDPLMQHPSPYLAMSNNPVLFTDPTGLWDFDENDGDYDFNFNNSNDSYKPKPKIKNIKNADPKKDSKIEKKRFTFGIYSGETFLNTFELPDNSSGTEVLNVHGKKRSVGSAYGEKAGRYISSTKNWALGLKAKKKNSTDWGGVADATLGIVGGGLEITAGVLGEGLTGGLSTIAIVDGVGRVGMNTIRLSANMAGKSAIGKALPSNIGGMAGKLYHGAVLKKGFFESGPAQGVFGVTNDAAAFVIGGGTNMHDLLFPTQVGLKSWSLTVSNNSLFLYDTFKPLIKK